MFWKNYEKILEKIRSTFWRDLRQILMLGDGKNFQVQEVLQKFCITVIGSLQKIKWTTY